MQKLQLVLLISGFVLIIQSCAPEPVFRLQSDYDGDEIIMHRGNEHLVSEMDHSTAIIAYYRHLNNRVIMDLEVVNYSEDMIRFDPSKISYQAYEYSYQRTDDQMKATAKRNLIQQGSALDPEKVMLNLDLKRSRAEADERTRLVFDGISAGFNAADDIASVGKLTAEQRTERNTERAADAFERAERREEYYRYASGLSEQRTYWEVESLRTTDLMPEESIAGEVSLPLAENAQEIEILVEVEDDIHKFRYKQRKYNP